MDVLIIEDELPAQQILIRLIKQYFPDFNIIGALDSVKAAAKYLQDNSPDLIFMDVELSDGKCFEIFRQTDIRCPVIITTAYADYALDAFKVKCIDYLMKPIESGAFRESVERCLQLCGVTAAKKDKPDITAYAKPTYKHHYTIKLGSQILAIDTRDIGTGSVRILQDIPQVHHQHGLHIHHLQILQFPSESHRIAQEHRAYNRAPGPSSVLPRMD